MGWSHRVNDILVYICQRQKRSINGDRKRGEGEGGKKQLVYSLSTLNYFTPKMLSSM